MLNCENNIYIKTYQRSKNKSLKRLEMDKLGMLNKENMYEMDIFHMKIDLAIIIIEIEYTNQEKLLVNVFKSRHELKIFQKCKTSKNYKKRRKTEYPIYI